MSKRVYVTRAQEIAARTIVERSEAKGTTVRSSVSKIANASGSSNRSKSAAASALSQKKK